MYQVVLVKGLHEVSFFFFLIFFFFFFLILFVKTASIEACVIWKKDLLSQKDLKDKLSIFKICKFKIGHNLWHYTQDMCWIVHYEGLALICRYIQDIWAFESVEMQENVFTKDQNFLLCKCQIPLCKFDLFFILFFPRNLIFSFSSVQ